MSGFSWDIKQKWARKRYYWPQDRVMAWWVTGWDWDRLDSTLAEKDRALDGALLNGSPAKQSVFYCRYTNTEERLKLALGDWLSPFGTDDSGAPLQ